MRILQFITLALSVALGMVWIFIVQNSIFLHVLAGPLSGPGMNIVDFLQIGSSPAFTVFWAGCISALLIWFVITLSSRPRSSAQTRGMQPMWWLAAALLTLFGWLCLGWFTAFSWTMSGVSPIAGSAQLFFPLPPGGWLMLMGFVMLDVILLFWLPTLVASPRTYRFVVPGAVTLLGSR